VLKPRDQWHTFWNAGDEPARILEIHSSAGFRDFFRELVGLGLTQAPPQLLADLCELQPDSVPDHRALRLRFPGEPTY
jgi:hypothetical protein